jgi:hypothetical protein
MRTSFLGTNRPEVGFTGRPRRAEDGKEMAMRKAILLAAALVVSASAAQAQGRGRDRDDDDSWRERREYREDRSRRDEDDRWHHGSGFRVGGARFFLRSGDTRLGVVCDREESMRNCVEAALILFDKVRQAGPSGTSGLTGGSSAPARQ